MNALEGRAALVTGTASGIGRAVAERLVSAEMRVLAVDLEPSGDGPGEPFEADLTTREGNAAAVGAFVRTPLVEGQVPDQAKAHGISEHRALEEVILAPHAIKELIEPSEVAEVVAFLLGPAGRSFTRLGGDHGPGLDGPLMRDPGGGKEPRGRRISPTWSPYFDEVRPRSASSAPAPSGSRTSSRFGRRYRSTTRRLLRRSAATRRQSGHARAGDDEA